MRFVELDSAAALHSLAQDFLLSDVTTNTLVLSALEDAAAADPSEWWGATALETDGAVAGCVVRGRAAAFAAGGSRAAAFHFGKMLRCATWITAIIAPEAVARACARGLGEPFDVSFALKLLRSEGSVDAPSRRPTGAMRPAEAADWNWLKASSEKFRAEAGLVEDVIQAERQLRSRLDAGTLRLWTGDRGERLAYVIGRPVGPHAMRLSTVYTVPAARRAGIAQSLVAAYSAELKQHGKREIHLFADRRNLTARSLYRRLGFRLHDRFLHLQLPRRVD